MCGYDDYYYGSARLRKALASHFDDYFAPHEAVTAEEITVASGLTAIHDMLSFGLCEEGDGVLLDRPVYGAFEKDLVAKAKYLLSASYIC